MAKEHGYELSGNDELDDKSFNDLSTTVIIRSRLTGTPSMM